MQDVYYNDTPLQAEIGKPVSGFGFAGEYEPLTRGDRARWPTWARSTRDTIQATSTGPGRHDPRRERSTWATFPTASAA